MTTQCWGTDAYGRPVTRQAKISIITRLMPHANKVWNCPSAKDFRCVSGPIPHHNTNLDVSEGPLPADVRVTYGFNEDMLVWGRKLADYQFPSETVVCADASGYATYWRIMSSNKHPCEVAPCDLNNVGLFQEHACHSGGSDVMFLDGHVKWLNSRQAHLLRYGP